MIEFSADWLALREPADVSARSDRLTRAIAGIVGHHPVPDVLNPLNVLDLASGTGSNVRYVAGHLPVHQHWLLIDRNPALLEQLPERMSSWADRRGYTFVREEHALRLRGPGWTCRVSTDQVDLNNIDDAGLFAGRGLVTASALLDLVSDDWLRSLAARCRESGAAVLFALTYDGRISCLPEEPEDEMIRTLVNRHQRTDKGFGAAVGPDATDRAEEYFTKLGYHAQREPSDWVLSSDAGELQRQLIAGWAEAATTMAPAETRTIAGWRSRRLAHVEGKQSRLVVGHADLAAWLPHGGLRAQG